MKLSCGLREIIIVTMYNFSDVILLVLILMRKKIEIY